MAAPEHVPSDSAAQPRTGLSLPPSRPFDNDRPGALGAAQPTGRGMGNPGPDQGYALTLAAGFHGRLVVPADEAEHDAVAGCTGVGLRRASIFGRAPVVHDLTVAFTIWGYLGEAPDELVALRKPLFQASAHSYADRRAIVDQVPQATLRLPHGELTKRFPADWRTLLGL